MLSAAEGRGARIPGTSYLFSCHLSSSLCLVGLCRALQEAALLVHDLGNVLNGLDFLLLEQRLPTLLADPGGDVVNGDVATVTVDVDRSPAPFHRSLAVNAFHSFFLSCYWPRAENLGVWGRAPAYRAIAIYRDPARSLLPSAPDLFQVGLGRRDVGDELADLLAGGVVGAQGAVLHLLGQTALADFALAAVTEEHALAFQAAHTVDVLGLELGFELLGPLCGGLDSQGLIVGLVGDESRTRGTVQAAHGQRLAGPFVLAHAACSHQAPGGDASRSGCQEIATRQVRLIRLHFSVPPLQKHSSLQNDGGIVGPDRRKDKGVDD